MGALFALLLIPVMALWGGFVVSTLWAWFLVPLGVKSVGWAGGYGISLVFSYLMSGIALKLKSDESWTWLHAVIANFIVGALFLLFGWLATLFM